MLPGCSLSEFVQPDGTVKLTTSDLPYSFTAPVRELIAKTNPYWGIEDSVVAAFEKHYSESLAPWGATVFIAASQVSVTFPDQESYTAFLLRWV